MLPVDVEGGFTTDGSGNGTDKRIIGTGHWTGVYASCQCNGNGQWVAGKNGRAQFFQQGANVLLGPIITRPGEQVQVTVAGASAVAAASVVYWGWQSDSIDGSDLAQAMPSVESAGSLSGSAALSLSGNVPVVNAPGTQLQVAQSQQHLTTISGLSTGGGTQTTTTAALPTGCHCIGIGAVNTIPLRQIQVTGHTTGIIYNTFLGATGSLFIVPILAPEDSQLDVTVVWVSGTPSPILYIDAILDPEAFMIIQEQTFNVGFDTTTNSPPWLTPNQVPIDFSVQLNAGSNVQLIAAPGATSHLWLHDVQYFYTATSASFGKFRRASGAGTPIASWNSNSAGVFRWGRGAPLATNEALFLSNDSAVGMAGFFNGTIEYSIG